MVSLWDESLVLVSMLLGRRQSKTYKRASLPAWLTEENGRGVRLKVGKASRWWLDRIPEGFMEVVGPVCVSCSVVSESLRPAMDCRWPGSSVHGILQARTLAFPFLEALPDLGLQVFSIAGRFFIVWATREARLGQKGPLPNAYCFKEPCLQCSPQCEKELSKNQRKMHSQDYCRSYSAAAAAAKLL